MKNELEDKLKEEFPQIFCDLRDSKPSESCMCFGIECNNGWYDLIRNLCLEIKKLEVPKEFKTTQVKEKFGGLRFYVSSETDEINKLIDQAEMKSYKVCEDCGSEEDVTSEGRPNWVSTLCKKCDEGRSNG